MKKITLTLLAAFTTLAVFAQEPAPSNPDAVNSQFFVKVVNGDTLLYHYKGPQYGWHRAAKYSDLKNYIPKSNAQIVVGDSTRRISVTFVGTSITYGAGPTGAYGVTYPDSGYVLKYSNLQGIKTINYGLSGRTLVQLTVGDSSAYSKRFLTPNYTPGSYIACECGVNDAVKDSTIYTPAVYNTQLTAWVDAQLSKGYPADHIVLIPSIAYFNPPSQPSSGHIESRHAQILAEAQAVATAKGTLLYDGFETFKTLWLATPTLLDAVVLHPTNTGSTIAANGLYNYLKTYISTISDNNPALSIAGAGESYWDFTVGNDLKIKKQPSTLAPNSPQKFVGYDAIDKKIKIKNVYASDVYNIWGAFYTTGNTDAHNIANNMPGLVPQLQNGNTHTNMPYTNSGSSQVMNIEYLSKTGLGNLLKIYWPYTTSQSINNGIFLEPRNGGTWGTIKHIVQTTGVGMPAAGQVPIGNGASDYTNKTLTGDVTVTSAGVTAIKGSVALGGNPTTTTQAAGTNNTTIATSEALFAERAATITLTNKTLATPKLIGYTVAALPAGAIGMMAYVTDATAPTYLGVLTGGGTVVTPVFYNGTAWVAH
ncbi:SGNH/GDSL hydrolase family protein [Mucilaginibacter aquariorum]|uniref:SGNH/GDSL hydrolase family protein n=1 Tax=Mucilaginibacter aquariorum TaxID=2967225 RepID=A0ABT1T6A6_9SPHI|nr:SGNH/GDSL hydrolase family protein [Mucilaginibacter aquariorum]MCQ6960160.1 SGNH/GDSL hydrolase family protein [Mucilaginibacter aquariorum]